MRTFWSDDRGQGILEYGLILGLVAMVAVGALLMLGGGVNSSLENAAGPRSDPAGGELP